LGAGESTPRCLNQVRPSDYGGVPLFDVIFGNQFSPRSSRSRIRAHPCRRHDWPASSCIMNCCLAFCENYQTSSKMHKRKLFTYRKHPPSDPHRLFSSQLQPFSQLTKREVITFQSQSHNSINVLSYLASPPCRVHLLNFGPTTLSFPSSASSSPLTMAPFFAGTYTLHQKRRVQHRL
jgi:hypothetical protein